MCSLTLAAGQAGRYGRSERSASHTSTTAKMRAASGISFALQAARVAGAVPLLVVAVRDIQRRPQIGDRRQQLVRVGRVPAHNRPTPPPSSVPGFSRMRSGMPILPMSCSSAPRRMCTTSASAQSQRCAPAAGSARSRAACGLRSPCRAGRARATSLQWWHRRPAARSTLVRCRSSNNWALSTAIEVWSASASTNACQSSSRVTGAR